MGVREVKLQAEQETSDLTSLMGLKLVWKRQCILTGSNGPKTQPETLDNISNPQ